MFSFPRLPQQWEKRLVRYIIHRLDLVEERTLGDLENIGGSFGRDSVFTVRDVGIKVERLRTLIKIPHRFELLEAVIGTLSISLSFNSFLSGAVEILISDVKIAVKVTPPPPDDVSEASSTSPPSTPRPGDRASELSPEEFPVSAEDLAQSFLQSQTRAEQQQLMSLYAEAPMDASIMSSITTSEEDEDEELGVGTSPGLPKMLASMFKGIADRMIVRVRGVSASLEATLPEEKGGEKVFLELEVEDVDIEGVSRNVSPSDSTRIPQEKPRKEGKRRITLENIRGFITATETMFGTSPEESAVFGDASEAMTEKGGVADAKQTTDDEEMARSIIRDASPVPRQPSTVAPVGSPQPTGTSPSDVGDEDGVDLQRSYSSQDDRFDDFEDSDEEVLAFVRPSMRASTRPTLSNKPNNILRENYFDNYAADDDSDDEVGGAVFASSMPQQLRLSPSASVISAGSSAFSSPSSSPPKTEPFVQPIPQPPIRAADPSLSPSPSPPPQALSDIESSEDEMDQEASRMLSQSTIFSREEADSLYMSATSGMLRSQSQLRVHSTLDGRDDIIEDIDADEMDQRLDRLINGESDFSRNSSLPPHTEGGCPDMPKARDNVRRIRKKCIDVDLVTIFYPSLSAGVTIVPRDETPARDRSEEMHASVSGFQQQDMPGAFSSYASRYAPRTPPPPKSSSPVPYRSPPRVKIVDSVDARPVVAPYGNLVGDFVTTGAADIEIIASNIHGTVDIHTEKMLAHLLEVVQDIIAEQDTEAPKKKPKAKPEPGPKQTVQLVAKEVDVRMIKHLGGFYTDSHEEDVGDPTIQLQCLLNDINLFRRGLDDEASTNKLSIKKFALKDEEEGIITFLRSAPPPVSSAKMSTSHHRKRFSASTTAGRLHGNGSGDEDDITVVFSQNAKKMRVNVKTLPLRIRGDLKRLEETFSAFGGVGSVLASTTASTATIGKAGRPPPWPENEAETPAVDIKVHCDIGGLFFDVVGTSAKVVLETSPIKVDFQSGKGVSVSVDKINISGPVPDKKDVSLVIEGTTMEFASRPTQEDLGRLLELLTPSKDRFDDDDILIDTLLRQREQGSVSRINVAGVRGELLDMDVFDAFKALGDEVIQVLSVTDFVAGDERPGLLTIINVEAVYAFAKIGGGIGRLEAEMDSVGITHISAPSLVAMAIGNISVRRNDHEELLGEGIDRRIFVGSQHERPMIMVRMVGDEPEPVVRVKLWNIRAEYNVQTLMAIMESPDGTTGEQLAQDVADSIITLPAKKGKADDAGGLGFDVVITDSVLSLNPLDLKSRGLIILTECRLQAALPTGGAVSAGMEIKKAGIMVIDDVDRLLAAEPGQMRGRREVLSEHLAGFVSMGYVPMVTISSAMVTLQVVGNVVDLEIRDDLLLIESCADSTQTMLAIFNGLKPPAVESDEIRYCTEVMPIENMLASLTEDKFVHPSRKMPGSMDTDEEDLVHYDEDLPTNLSFVESYYGHKTPPVQPSEALADSMLEEDLLAMRIPNLSREGSGNDSIFKEDVKVLDSIVIVEDHFGRTTLRRRGKRSLNQTAVEKAEFFPLRVRVRDVHVIFNLHDGYDWQRTRDTISQAVRKVESKVAERRNRRVSFDMEEDDESVVDDFLFNSIYIGIPANRAPGDLTNDINRHFDDQMSETSYATTTAEGRPLSARSRSTVTGDFHHSRSGKNRSGLKLSRSRHHKMQFELKGVNVDFLLFPPTSDEVQLSVDARIRDLEIFDNVPTSTWRKFVTYCQECGDREINSDMVRLECMVVKPVPGLAATELILKANILPLRLHVDQDTLDFLTRFFEFKDDSASAAPPGKALEEPFLQRVEINAVRVKLDYKPKYVDYGGLRSGHTTEFMNFFILEEADMVLRRVILHGISGFTRMSKVLNDTWMPDIQTTQLGGVLAGVAPVRSLVNLGKGARDLVVVPVREYRKDGRIVRSLQKGVGGFVRNTAGELVRLGAKVAVGTQALLQSAEGALSGGSENYAVVEVGDDDYEPDSERIVSLYADQPESVMQGLRGASRSLRRNFGEARDAILTLPAEMAEGGDARGVAAAVARAAPRAVIRPVIGVSEAVGRTLMGVGNAMEPERRRAREDKYKHR
ncbi:hypothetical protein BZA05DRAFT_346478 [Tricharina praecox]|uniref:uncharacterized protein n=1 Tax=Tricharina praecox TaxID=43433 RepID=UPI00221F61A7|nr:uncharacterized protein BZA05DRAFT_346478 [Tricharina praecox]KAI5859035.1 hypothetical protein BZA05DRAFT_346478 [Tricharina praecox]